MVRGTAARRVAYVAYTFPVLTQTFTTREVAALQTAGVELTVFAARRDAGADLDPEALTEAARTEYLPPPVSLATLGALIAFAFRRPLRLLLTFGQCLGGRYADDALRCRLRAPLHFSLGVALASRLRASGGFGRVHAQFVDAGSTLAFVAARLLDLPFSFTNHTAYNPFLLRVKARYADRIVSISDYDRQSLLAQCGPLEAEITVNRVGIRVDDWSGIRREPDAGRVLSVGALRAKKGHDILLRAAALLAAEGREVRVVAVGGGHELSRLQTLAESLGVGVDFVGAAGPDRVRAELGRAQAFCLACRVAENGDLDGIPVALMEAMAAGVPCVSTRISGIPELIEHEVSGLLAEPGDARSLADQLSRVLDDDGLAERLGDAGRERVRGFHDLTRTAGRMAALLGTSGEGVR